MIRIESLQQRFTLFILLPVGMLLFLMGILGFIHLRNKLLTQWGEAAILRLQRAAHQVDMRLSRPHELLKLYGATGNKELRELIARRLGEVGGVVRVLHAPGDESTPSSFTTRRRMGKMHFSAMGDRIAVGHSIMPAEDDGTISLVSEFRDENGMLSATLEVVLNLSFLVKDSMDAGWWQTRKAFLVDSDGNILTGTMEQGRRHLGEKGDELEEKTLEALNEKSSGTVFGKAHPALEVSGFYRLKTAPWYLVVFAPGREILWPVIHFLLLYLCVVSGLILFILLIIRRETERTAASIRLLSKAAARITHGDYTDTLKVKSRDEVGQLTENFNTMSRYLKERSRLKQSMNLAKEVQQNLLPGNTLVFQNLDIAGASIYCDETGGDYYDFIRIPEQGEGRLGIAVGDVVGHGIASALLMTTVRALLRSRISLPGTLSSVISDVNGNFCMDTDHSGSFMTLFFMTIDVKNREIIWVRAGHEPALVYDTEGDTFTELKGPGIPLGVDRGFQFKESRILWRENQIVLIGTDGIWETENPLAERFGKERFFDVVRSSRDRTSLEIMEAVNNALGKFREGKKQEDDVTLIVIRSLS